MIRLTKLLTPLFFLGLSAVSPDGAADEKTRDIAERVFRANSLSEKDQLIKDLEELEKREQKGDAGAKFYLAFHSEKLCRLTKNSELRTSSKLCSEAFARMRSVAENQAIRTIWLGPASMEEFAKMHLDGIGVEPSAAIASLWFAKTGRQLFENGHAEAALRQVEAALNAMPDNPAALQLRDEIFLSQK